MKQRSTTPVSSPSFAARACIVAAAILTMTVAPFTTTMPAKADRYDDQINAIQNEIDAYNSQASKLSKKAQTLQNELSRLNNEKARIQKQIDLSQAKYAKLVKEIKQNEQKIAENKQVLGDTIADLYVDDNISPLEMLASSKNIGDYVDKQSYRSTVRDELTKTIDEIKTLKKQLEGQKVSVNRVLGDQKNSRKALVEKENERQKILNETQGKESAYRKLSAQNKAKQAEVRQQQQAAIAAAINSSGGATVISGGAAPDYPWGPSNCQMSGYYSLGGADGNGGDGKGYGCRQCASYAAWRVARETGRYPINWGNATNFPSSARASGYSTGYSPRAGSLAVMHSGTGPEGHVAWVESVNGDGTLIVSQYNYNYGEGYGMYSKMKLSASVFQEYVYIK